MRTIEITVYTIDELSEKAKEKAYHNWLQQNDYPWENENRKTLEEFCRIFPVKVIDWSYGYWDNYIHFQFTGDENIENLSGLRLLKYIYNNYYDCLFKGKFYYKEKYVNGKYEYKCRRSKIIKDNSCVLTGYDLDDVILKPIYDFLKKPKEYITFYDLMKECLNTWVKACSEDYQYCTSMEYFIELSRINGWEYRENGEMI